MQRVLISFFSLVFSLPGYAQEKALNEIQTTNAWCNGSILLNNGEALEGLLRYDDKNSVLAFKSADQTSSYTARGVSAFDFFDVDAGKQRTFYSLEYMDPKNNAIRPLFFELLGDFTDFAVISKIDPVDITTKSSTSPIDPGYMDMSNPNTYGKQTEIAQTETVYFLNANGDIEPYLKVVRTVIDRQYMDREKTKNKIVDKDLIEKYFKKEEIDLMRGFAERNELEFRVKNDLIRILNYCLEIRAKKEN